MPDGDEPIEVRKDQLRAAWVQYFVIVVPLVIISLVAGVLLNKCSADRQAQAERRQQQQMQQGFRKGMQQAQAEQAAAVSAGQQVIVDIMGITPRGKSPRTVPFPKIVNLEQDMHPAYELEQVPSASYASTGKFDLLGISAAPSAFGEACVVVPDRVRSPAQIRAALQGPAFSLVWPGLPCLPGHGRP